MKAYVIVVDDVYDFERSASVPSVKFTKKEAQKEMRYLANEVKPYFVKRYAEGLVYSSGDMSIEMYPEGYFGQTHYVVSIHQIDIPGVKKVLD